jgi:hypothetical protein
MKTKTPNSKSNPEQKEQCQSYHNMGFQIMLQSHSQKNSTVLAQKSRHTDHWTRIEDPAIKPHNYSHLILMKESKTVGKRQPLQQMVLHTCDLHAEE